MGNDFSTHVIIPEPRQPGVHLGRRHTETSVQHEAVEKDAHRQNFFFHTWRENGNGPEAHLQTYMLNIHGGERDEEVARSSVKLHWNTILK